MDRALAQRMAALSDSQRALLQQRLAARRAHAEGPAPVSTAQWRLWFLEQMRPGTSTWHTPLAARLRGPLDADALAHALEDLIERHASLRTTIRLGADGPEATTAPAPRIDVPLLDLTRLSPATRELAVKRFVAEEVGRPFDLGADLMVRLRLARLAEDEHLLVLVAHHIACDGWSKGILVSELSALYDARVSGGAADLAPLPMTFGDWARAERERLTPARREALADGWRELLAGHTGVLELPTDRPRPAVAAQRGGTVQLALGRDVSARVAEVARQEGATPFMAMLAAFGVLVGTLSGERDVLVGSPAAMRTTVEAEGVIGFFANTLAYRVDLAGDPSFATVIRRVRRSALAVFANQELPFDEIVKAVNPVRDAGRNPLVQVNFRLEGEEPRLRLAGIEVEALDVDPGIARFDLAIELGWTPDGYRGYLEYDRDLFTATTAERLARAFGLVVGALLADPGTDISQLELEDHVQMPGGPDGA